MPVPGTNPQVHVSVDPSPGFVVEPSNISVCLVGGNVAGLLSTRATPELAFQSEFTCVAPHGPDDPSTRTQSLGAPITVSNAPVESTIAARPLA
jgi:hypothetical protein